MASIARACRKVGGREPVEETPDPEHLDLSDPFDAEVISACSELFTNVVRHGYGGDSDASVEIEIEPHPDRIVIRITDNGSPFDPETIAAPELNLLPERGMGIYILRSFVDRATYEPGPPNKWILEKAYPSTTSQEPVE